MILHAGKDVENRTWTTPRRGRFLIHAGKGCTRSEYEEARIFCEDVNAPAADNMPDLAAIPRGGIVGIAEIVDCVSWSRSPWFVGDYGFVIRNARPLPFQPCRGALGFFRIQNMAMDGHLSVLNDVRSAQRHFGSYAPSAAQRDGCLDAVKSGLLESVGEVMVCDADGGFTDEVAEGFVLTAAGREVLAIDDARRDEAWKKIQNLNT